MLPAEPSEDVRFFVVWVNRGTGDNRASVDPTILEDERVAQYWDGKGLTGATFASEGLGGLGEQGFIYDVYYVFGRDATWEGKLPGPVTAVGARIVDGTDRVLAEVRAQL